MDKETFSMSLKENSRLLIVASVDRGERQVNALSNELKSQILRLLCTDYTDLNNSMPHPCWHGATTSLLTHDHLAHTPASWPA